MRHESGDDERLAAGSLQLGFEIRLGKRIRQRLFHSFTSEWLSLRGELESCAIGIEQATRSATLRDMDDRRAGRARRREQIGDPRQCRVDAGERQLAGDIFVLRIDDNDSRVRQSLQAPAWRRPSVIESSLRSSAAAFGREPRLAASLR
jgi:hypothetical protein